MPTVCFRKDSKEGSRSPARQGCQRPMAPKQQAEQTSHLAARERDNSSSDAPTQHCRPKPPGEKHSLLPATPLLFPEAGAVRSGGPQVCDGEGPGRLALRHPRSPSASRAPAQRSPASSGHQSPSRVTFQTRPLTRDPPPPERLPRQVLKASAPRPSRVPAPPGHAVATHPTSACGEHARCPS